MKTVICNTCKHRDDLTTDSCALCYPDLEALGNYEFNNECNLCLFSTRQDRIKEIKNETIDKFLQYLESNSDYAYDDRAYSKIVDIAERFKKKLEE